MSLFKGLGKWYWGWLGFITGPIVGAVAVFLWLRNIAVKDWVFLALIVVIGLGEVYVFLYIRHNEKKLEGLEKTPKPPKPNKEILYILGRLADTASGYLSRGALNVIYNKEFEGQKVDEFTAVTGALRGSGLTKDAPYPTNQEGIYVTDEGSKYYLKHKERAKK